MCYISNIKNTNKFDSNTQMFVFLEYYDQFKAYKKHNKENLKCEKTKLM